MNASVNFIHFLFCFFVAFNQAFSKTKYKSVNKLLLKTEKLSGRLIVQTLNIVIAPTNLIKLICRVCYWHLQNTACLVQVMASLVKWWWLTKVLWVYEVNGRGKLTYKRLRKWTAYNNNKNEWAE